MPTERDNKQNLIATHSYLYLPTHILRHKVPSLLESLYGGGAKGGSDLEDGDVVPELAAVLGNGHQLLHQGTPLTGLVT